MARSFLITIAAANLLSGCASTLPPMTADDPASPTGPEPVSTPTKFSLPTDAATLRTRRLLAVRAQQDSGNQSQENQSNQAMPGMQNMPELQQNH